MCLLLLLVLLLLTKNTNNNNNNNNNGVEREKDQFGEHALCVCKASRDNLLI